MQGRNVSSEPQFFIYKSTFHLLHLCLFTLVSSAHHCQTEFPNDSPNLQRLLFTVD